MQAKICHLGYENLKLKANSCKTNQKAVRVRHPEWHVQKLVFRHLTVFVLRNFELRRKFFYAPQFNFVRCFHLNFEFFLRAGPPQNQFVLQKIVAFLLFELLQAKLEKFEFPRRFADNYNVEFVYLYIYILVKNLGFIIGYKQY